MTKVRLGCGAYSWSFQIYGVVVLLNLWRVWWMTCWIMKFRGSGSVLVTVGKSKMSTLNAVNEPNLASVRSGMAIDFVWFEICSESLVSFDGLQSNETWASCLVSSHGSIMSDVWIISLPPAFMTLFFVGDGFYISISRSFFYILSGK